MQRILLSLSGLLITALVFGQDKYEVIPSEDVITDDLNRSKSVVKYNKAGSCVDTIIYINAKRGTGTISAINLNTANSAKGAAVFFPSTQKITVDGFSFYAYYSDHPVEVQVNLYGANKDSIPVGPALYRDTVTVPQSNYSTLSAMERPVVFDSSVTVNNGRGFYVAISMINADTVNVISTDYNAGAGQQEWLTSLLFTTGWVRSYDVNVGGIPYDADFFMEPYVSYDPVAEITTDTGCIANAGDSVHVLNTSPLMASHIYNMELFNSNSTRAAWDFDDGTGLIKPYGLDTSHAYAAAGDYTLSLTDTMVNWSGQMCSATDTHNLISNAPNVDFSYTANGQTVTFTPNVTYASPLYWDFGDGDTSHVYAPTHWYNTPDTYIAKLYAKNACGLRIKAKTVAVQSNSIEELNAEPSLYLYPNPVHDKLWIETENIGRDAELKVFNILGEELLRRGQLQPTTVLDLSGWPEGTYIVSVKDRQHTYVQKISLVN